MSAQAKQYYRTCCGWCGESWLSPQAPGSLVACPYCGPGLGVTRSSATAATSDARREVLKIDNAAANAAVAAAFQRGREDERRELEEINRKMEAKAKRELATLRRKAAEEDRKAERASDVLTLRAHVAELRELAGRAECLSALRIADALDRILRGER